MTKEYGYDECPLDKDGNCFDYDRYGSLACGLCGANKELQQQGYDNLTRAITKDTNQN